jgi:phage gpG-like protein
MAVQTFAKLDDKRIKKFLKSLESKNTKVSQAQKEYTKRIAPIVFADIMDHFENEQGPKGQWAEWSDIYASHMAKIGKSGNNILQDTGRLRQSFLPTNSRKASNGILWFNPAKTDTGFPYASHHDETAKTTRPFMWLSPNAMELIGEATLDFIIGE